MPSSNPRSWQQTAVATAFALTAFAANSVFCRMALGDHAIDAPSFTLIRLVSGALVLLVLTRLPSRQRKKVTLRSIWGPVFLFVYALGFSLAYLTLDTATGALILFGSVQLTMILYAQFTGDKLHLAEWLGVVLAFAGFVYLVYPNLGEPSLIGFGLMTVAGIGWGSYSLIGRSSTNPLADTCSNFVKTWPFLILLVAFTFSNAQLTTRGMVLAMLSGTLASGAGYSVWYLALGGLSATQAAVAQLLVPVIAGLGGVFLVGESLTRRLVFAGLLILGGIAMVFFGKNLSAKPEPAEPKPL